MIVTIDGPAGAGKSSAARLLARRLGFEYLDTGAMFRAVTLAALEKGLDLKDEKALAHLLENLRLEMPPGRVLLDQKDVTEAIRRPEVTAASGPVASSPVVRDKLARWQRGLAQGRNIVCEGRDQGTVVFPEAPCKFFLMADPRERARRRQRELQERGIQTTLEQVFQDQQTRDQRDAARDLAPMVRAADAITLDSTPFTLDQVVDRMEEIVRGAMSGARSAEGGAGTAKRGNTSVDPTSPSALGAPLTTLAAPPLSFQTPHPLASWLVYKTGYVLGSVGMTLAFSLRIEGGRHIPKKGPALLVSNHQSFFDPWLIGCSTYRPLVYLARKSLFGRNFWGWLIRHLNGVPIDQEGLGKEGIKKILEQLQQGQAVVVFPEGHRTSDGNMQKLMPGIHLLIKRSGAPIIPIGIAGAYEAWPRSQYLPRPSPLFLPVRPGAIALSLGRPLDSRRLAQMDRGEALEELSLEIKNVWRRAEKLRRK